MFSNNKSHALFSCSNGVWFSITAVNQDLNGSCWENKLAVHSTVAPNVDVLAKTQILKQ